MSRIISNGRAHQLRDREMQLDNLNQRNVVGVISGLMGSGKTTLLRHLYGLAYPNIYNSTGVAESLVHHRVSTLGFDVAKPYDIQNKIDYKDIYTFISPLIKAGMNEAVADHLVRKFMQSIHASYVHCPTSSPVGTLALLQPEKYDPLGNMVLELACIIDTGGQPQMLEVMPSLIQNISLAMVLIDLQCGLDGYPKSYYYSQRGAEFQWQFSSYYTNRDIILKLVSTFHAKKSNNEAFHLLIIATHHDLVEMDRVETLNDELSSLLLPVFQDELILFKPPKRIAFTLNLKNPDNHDQEVLHMIRSIVGRSHLGENFNTPSSFIVLEQNLLEFAKNEKRQILHLSECKKIGEEIKMSGEMVEAALVLFHNQNTFLYFRHVLPDHVFVNPQVPLDIVNEIAHHSYYKMGSGKLKGIRPQLFSQLKNGIITEGLLKDISSHFREGFYEVYDAIKLLCHTLIIAPLQSDTAKKDETTTDEKEYLMMCLTPTISHQELHQYIPESSDTVPLVIQFSSGCVPLGCLISTICCLQSKFGWKITRKRDGTPKCLAHNIVSLHDPDLLVNVIIVDFIQYVELHIEPDLNIHDSLADLCSQVHSRVLSAVENVFNIMQLDTNLIRISSAVLCNICTEIQAKHFAEFVNTKNKYLLRCGLKYSKPTEKQLLWMGIDAASKDSLLGRFKKPTLQLLGRFPTHSGGVINIIERIGTSNHDLGIHLLNDDTGLITANIIKAQYRHDPPTRATEAILQRWLRGTGRTPQSWDTLITVLKDIELKTLARDIEDNLFNIQVQTKPRPAYSAFKPNSEGWRRKTWCSSIPWYLRIFIAAVLIQLLLYQYQDWYQAPTKSFQNQTNTGQQLPQPTEILKV